jgi:hypothetical protein
LVYGRPDTWDGFWYVALAEQFRGSLVAPFADLPGKVGVLVDRTVTAFGPLAAILPLAFGVTAIRRPAYALFSGTAVAITCFFAASYDNAMIERYYAGPVLFAWTWIAILIDGIVTLAGFTIERPRRPQPLIAGALALLLLLPTAAAAPQRLAALDRSRDLAARRWVDNAFEVMRPGAVVISWWSYSTPLWYAQYVEGRRLDIDIIDDRTRLDRNLGDLYDVIDANLPVRPVYVIRIEPDELAGVRDRYDYEVVDMAAPSPLLRIASRRESPE